MAAASTDCIFCKIVQGSLPSYKIFENEHVIAILDAFPATEGHTLVIPKAHHMDLIDLPAEIGAQVLPICSKVAKALVNQPGIEGVNLVQNSRPASGQIVMHTHFHLIPRRKDDHLLKHPASGPKIDAAAAQKLVTAISSAM